MVKLINLLITFFRSHEGPTTIMSLLMVVCLSLLVYFDDSTIGTLRHMLESVSI